MTTSVTSVTTVLVADDSPVARLTLARALRAAGFVVVEAGSLDEGKNVDTDGIDVAILDLDLGDGSGTELFTALRGKRPDLQAAFFSGGADGWSAAAELGPVFRKPEELEGLLAWVRDVRDARARV